MRVRPGRAPSRTQGLVTGCRGHLHARGPRREPGGDRLDVRRLPRARLAMGDGRGPVRARDARRDVCRLGDRHTRARRAAPRGHRHRRARRPRRVARPPVHHPPIGRPRVHGAVPDRRRVGCRDDPDVRACVGREPPGRAARAEHPRDDGARLLPLVMLRIRRVRRRVVHRVRPLGAARLPRVRTDDGHEARGPLRGDVLERVLPNRADRRGRGDVGRVLVGAGDLGMSAAVTAEATDVRWSPMRVAIGLVLLGWATMFWTLWLTGRTYLYLSSRTAWLVPMGAAIMSVAAIGRLSTARTAKEEPLEPRTAWALGVIALPVVLVLALPPSALGAFSAGKRSTFAGSAIGATARDVTGPLDFVDIGAAQSFPTAMQQLEARAGQPITLEGFVTTEASAPPDEVLLTRYIVTCCVADATVAQVRIVGLPPGTYPTDEWLRGPAPVYRVGRGVLVAAHPGRQSPVPPHPSLTPEGRSRRTVRRARAD